MRGPIWLWVPVTKDNIWIPLFRFPLGLLPSFICQNLGGCLFHLLILPDLTWLWPRHSWSCLHIHFGGSIIWDRPGLVGNRSFPLVLGPSSPVGHTILDHYVVPPLETYGDPPVFRPDWGIHINNRVAHPGVALEMLKKLPLLKMRCSLPSTASRKDLFASSLMQVRVHLRIKQSFLLCFLTFDILILVPI